MAALLSGCGAPPAPAAPAAPTVVAPAAPPPSAPPASAQPAAASDPVNPAPPARIRVAALDVDVPVVPVGVDDRGEMAVPEDIRTVGWYRFGAGPGANAGSAVLSGHVNDRVQGKGAFYDLVDLSVGDDVQVDLADGTTLDYRVSRVQSIDKATLPVERLFTREGAPVLTLVTCGGDFDRATRNYRQNVVVTAQPEGR